MPERACRALRVTAASRGAAGLAVAALALVSGWAAAQAPVVPHLGERGQADFGLFQAREVHRAFVIAPGGAWSWRADAESPQAALAGALADCSKRTAQKCVPYAVDDEIVFDAKAWPALWRPYKSKAEAERAVVGKRRGERFHDLALRDAAGKPVTLSALRGKVVVLHFWGSWCTPCRQEMPDMERTVDALAGRPDVAFVLAQVREDFSVSRKWAAEHGMKLPLFDSGSTGEDDAVLRLAGGGTLKDREVALVFPTTYVLDRNGVVVFSHVGPIPRWAEYRDFLLDAAARSGK